MIDLTTSSGLTDSAAARTASSVIRAPACSPPTAGPPPPGAPTERPGVRAPMERLEQRLLADRRATGEELEVGVADHRVADLAERRQDGVDEPLAALGRADVDPRGVVVDEVGQDRVRGPDRLAPQVGRLADDLVGVLALGQPDDADVGQPDAAVGLDLGDEVVQLGHAERAGALARPGRRRRPGRPSWRSGVSSATWPGVSAVPRLATTLSKPAWWAMSASV